MIVILLFLDINPLKAGHTLVVPKVEVDYVFDLDDVCLSGLFVFAKRVAGAIRCSVACNRVGVSVMGLEVPHAHVHLIPINSEGDMNFSNDRVSFSEGDFGRIASDIASYL